MTTVEDINREIREVNKELTKVNGEIAKWTGLQRRLQERQKTLKKSIDKLNSEKLANVDWAGNKYKWSAKVDELLHSVFKLDSFRPKQLSAINATLSGQHALVVMPTGAGKSLCYQLPALASPGLTLVISPLISLMEDQIRSLDQRKIPAALMTMQSGKEATNSVLNALKDKNTALKLLYVTPERLAKSKRFMANLQKSHSNGCLQRIAIDEVHCCSQWGHDFRPDYKFLNVLATMFEKVPILGLTATATAHVLNDVQKILNIPGCLVIKSTFNRPNLFYKILEKPSSQDACMALLNNLLKSRYAGQTGIIYTHSIKDSEEVAAELRKLGHRAACYHANMENSARSKVHTKWHEGSYKIIVATVAFGMGIDKQDVRFVIHHTISKSMENYYQESGRAGRDGEHAECVTLYRLQDVFKVSTMVFSTVNSLDHLYGMVKYCLNGKLCRRQLIAEHFEEDWGNEDCNEMCDICINDTPSSKEISLEKHCNVLSSLMATAEKQDVRLTAQKLLDAWYLKGPVNLRHKGEAPNFARSLGEDVIAFLMVNNYLEEDFLFTAYSTISYLKPGPNMDLAKDPDFELKMPIRKYTIFSSVSKDKVDDSKSVDSKRKSNSNSESKSKKSKTLVIDSSSEDKGSDND